MRVVELARRIGRRGMRSYAHDTSPKVFARPRTFACLILKASLGDTYRGLIDQRALNPAVGDAIGLKRLPHFTALEKFACRQDVPARAGRLITPGILWDDRADAIKVRRPAVGQRRPDSASLQQSTCET